VRVSSSSASSFINHFLPHPLFIFNSNVLDYIQQQQQQQKMSVRPAVVGIDESEKDSRHPPHLTKKPW
jgi:hypothetical protein